jgi:hypothetical protein
MQLRLANLCVYKRDYFENQGKQEEKEAYQQMKNSILNNHCNKSAGIEYTSCLERVPAHLLF